jgi:Glycosyltransferase family 87
LRVHSEAAVAAKEETRISVGWRILWFLVWGAMGLAAAVNAWSPYGGLSGRAGIVIGILLAALAALLLAVGGPVLRHRRDVALTWVVLVLFGAGVFGQRLHTIGPRIDFGAYYVAAHLAAEHPHGRLYYPAYFPDGRTVPHGAAKGWNEVVHHYGLSEALTFVYPPFFAVLLTPLAYFSYGAAYGLWNAGTALLTFASVWIIFRLGGRRISVELAVALVAGLFSYNPFFTELVVGQAASLLLFLCALGAWLLSQDRDWPSAFCFAVATMIKMTPIVVVPLLAMHRKWKWLAAYGCWMVVLTFFTIWRMGWATHEQFLHEVMPSMSCGVATFGDVSIVAYVQELFLGYVPMDGWQSTLPRLACTVSKAVAFFVLGLGMFQFYRYRRGEKLVLHLVLLLLLSLAISPITWIHHYVIALLPFLYLWCKEREGGVDWLLTATVLIVGTNVTGYGLLLSHSHAMQLVLAAIVPCMTIALVFFEVSRESWSEGNYESA